MSFQFKQFSVEDNQSAMKVGTDAVLLGSWVQLENEKTILDIGTGSGVIALMMAQKSKTQIDAIDFDKASILQAERNFQKSPWFSQLRAIHISLQNYIKSTAHKYDLIVSNPPFFDQSLKSPIKEKNISKHTESLKFNELAQGIRQLLNPTGKAYLILPPVEASQFIDEARIEGLFCRKKLYIIPIEGKPINRWIFEISSFRTKLIEEELTIRDKNQNYTNEYKELTKDFYLIF